MKKQSDTALIAKWVNKSDTMTLTKKLLLVHDFTKDPVFKTEKLLIECILMAK